MTITDNIDAIAKRCDTATLRAVRDSLERELLADMTTGVRGTQTHAGKLEMIDAIGRELLARTSHEPSYVDICHEDGIRYPFTVRVF